MLRLLKNYFSEDRELLLSLKKILGFYPRNIELYKTALMHKSIKHRNEKGKPVNNERLEFLGDAVLDAVVGDIVYRRYPGKREGFLTNTRSKLVQRETLGKLAKEMGINRLILSSGQSQSHNSYLGGNAFEALVGAVYLDRGYEQCMKFMEKQILNKRLSIDKVAYKEVNFKSKLLEWSQKNRIKLEYQLIEQSKDENGSPVFVYKVMLETVEGFQGRGFSKKEAQQEASKLTLAHLKKNKQYHDSIFAAKSERTQMEEEPVMVVPELNEATEKIPSETSEPRNPSESRNSSESSESRNSRTPRKSSTPSSSSPDTSFSLDLDDIQVKTLSREDIIAQAEAEAYGAQ